MSFFFKSRVSNTEALESYDDDGDIDHATILAVLFTHYAIGDEMGIPEITSFMNDLASFSGADAWDEDDVALFVSVADTNNVSNNTCVILFHVNSCYHTRNCPTIGWNIARGRICTTLRFRCR